MQHSHQGHDWTFTVFFLVQLCIVRESSTYLMGGGGGGCNTRSQGTFFSGSYTPLEILSPSQLQEYLLSHGYRYCTGCFSGLGVSSKSPNAWRSSTLLGGCQHKSRHTNLPPRALFLNVPMPAPLVHHETTSYNHPPGT